MVDTNFLRKISDNAPAFDETDYLGKDGLIYCHKCNSALECIVNLCGVLTKVRCQCKCGKARFDAEQEEAEQRKFDQRVRDLQHNCFPVSALLDWNFAVDDNTGSNASIVSHNYVAQFDEMKRRSKGLLFHGGIGCGKSFYAACVANELVNRGISVQFTSLSRILNIIQGMPYGKQDYIDSLNRFELIVFDDFGAERSSDFVFEQTLNIFDSRCCSGLPFIVTTNMTLEEIKASNDIRYNRIYDRVLERCYPVLVEGQSRRRAKVCEDYSEIKELLEGNTHLKK